MDLKVYTDGQEFLDTFHIFLDRHFPESCFLIGNSPAMKSIEDGYSIAVADSGNNILLGQCRYPYKLTLVGDKYLVGELYRYLKNERVEIPGVLGEKSLVEEFIRHCSFHHLRNRLQYMENGEGSIEGMDGVTIATEEDIDQLVNMDQLFRAECDVYPLHSLEFLMQRAQGDYMNYAVLKVNSRVVAQAKLSRDDGKHVCISGAITDQDYRNKGYMRKVISFLTAVAWSRDETPYLFVDESNPISNHLYESIGYTYGPHFVDYEVLL